MVSVDELASLPEGERAEMLAALLALTAAPAAPKLLWQRRLVIVVTMSIAATVLTGWIVYLIVALPMERAPGWRFAWVGFDIAELATYVVTAWAAWRYRRFVVLALFASAILLLCDAWFDMSLSWRTPGWGASVLLSVAVEIPMAVLLIVLAVRIRRSVEAAIRAAIGLAGAPARVRTLLDPLPIQLG
jgi:hypothetical protein